MKQPKKRAFSATQWAVGEVDQLLLTVARYTRFVLYSKWFLGVLAIALLGGLILWPLIGKDKAGLRVSFTSSDPANNASAPIMSSPHFTGDNEKGERYSVTGTRAVQQTATLVRIEQAEAQLLKTDGHIINGRADVALYHQDSKILEMHGHTTMFNDAGTVFTTDNAITNTNTLDTDGQDPVEGVNATGKLVAIGFQIRDKGNLMIFGTAKPGVKVHIERMKKQP